MLPTSRKLYRPTQGDQIGRIGKDLQIDLDRIFGIGARQPAADLCGQGRAGKMPQEPAGIEWRAASSGGWHWELDLEQLDIGTVNSGVLRAKMSRFATIAVRGRWLRIFPDAT